MSHLFRCLCFLVGGVLLAGTAHAQAVGYGDWQLHLPTNRPSHLADTGDKLYVATESAFYVLNKAENTTQVLSRRDGLNDVGVAGLAYDSVRRQTVVVYKNNNIDILRPDGSVRNLNDILRKSIIGRRDIYQVYVAGNSAYLSAYFGLVVLNLDKLEVSATYSNIGLLGAPVQVFSTTVANGRIFAATSGGLLHASLSSNLLDYRSWTVRRPAGLQPTFDLYRSVATFNGKVYAMVEGGDLHRFNPNTAGNWDVIYGAYTFRLTRLRSTTAGLLILDLASGIRVMNRNEAFSQLIPPSSPGANTYDAVRSNSDGSYFVASSVDGLLQVFPGTTRAPERFVANGPETSRAYSLLADARSNSVTVFSDGYSDRYLPSPFPAGFYEYAGGQWKNTSATVYPSASDYPNPGAQGRGTRTPDGTLYLASYNNGLLEWKGPGQFRQFNSTTGNGNPLRDWGVPNTDRVTDVAATPEGDVWVVNQHRRPSGTGLFLYKPASNTWVPGPDFVGASNLDRIALDDNGFVWVSEARKNDLGYPLGVFAVDPTPNAPQTRAFTVADGLPNGEVYDLVKDREGNIWAGTLEGVAVLYGSSGAFLPDTKFVTPFVDRGEGTGFNTLYNEAVKAIAVDGGNRKWFGTDNGLWLFSPDAKEALLHFTTDNSPLPSNRILDVDVNDRTGEVWVATDAGVVSYRGSATITEGKPNCTQVSPNPVRPDFAGRVGISGLANNALVKITDIAGHLVYATKANGGTVDWNMTDAQGRRVRSGVYLVLSSDADGKNGCVSKVAVLSK